MVLGLDRLWERSAPLAEGLLQIASGHTASNIAIGRRFFAVCVLPPDSPLVARELTKTCLPPCWGDDWRKDDPFERPNGQ